MDPEAKTLLLEVLQNRREIHPHLLYADWLEENASTPIEWIEDGETVQGTAGSIHCELIRLQCATADLESAGRLTPEYDAHRARELIVADGYAACAVRPTVASEAAVGKASLQVGPCELGLWEACRCDPEALRWLHLTLLPWHPIRTVVINGGSDAEAAVAELEALAAGNVRDSMPFLERVILPWDASRFLVRRQHGMGRSDTYALADDLGVRFEFDDPELPDDDDDD